jgi:peptide/nickel transport system substrate-binding protein/oligopeptide transport system substrate-binding protein
MKYKFLFSVFLCSAILLFSEETPPNRELVVAFVPTEINLNPLNSFTSTEAQVYTALYEGLVTYDPLSLEPLPGVARSWEISPDGKTYTFRLRDDAKYGNGDPVTAQDFKNSWLRFLDPKTNAEYSFLYDIIQGAEEYRTGANPDPESVRIKVLSATRLQVVLEEPATHFLKILCHHSFLPIHPTLLQKTAWNSLPEIVNNGPYLIEKRDTDHMLLRKNPYYWDAKQVKVEYIRLLFVDDPNGTTGRFNDYEIHWVSEGMSLDKVVYQDTIIINPLFSTQYFYFSNLEKPWNDGRVRRALALLVPWPAIRSTDFYFIPAKTLVPPIPKFPSPEAIEASNPQEALRLLEEAGYPRGAGLPKIVIKLSEGDGTRRAAALMAAAWKEIGIDSEIITYQYPEYFKVLKTGDYTLGTISWIGDFADPLTFLQMWTQSSNLNDGKFSDMEYEELLKKSMGQSGEDRYKTLSRAESIILKTAQVLPLSHTPAINLIDLHYISGWYRNPLDIHPFKYLSFAPFKPLPGVVRADRNGFQSILRPFD